MATPSLDINIEEMRDGLRRIVPPFLVRRYEATPEEYEQISDEDLRCEYLDGVLIVHSPATVKHERRIGFLYSLLSTFVAKQRRGEAFLSNVVMQVGERRFCPDLSFLATEHMGKIQNERVMGPLDLVVEILSKSTRDYDLREKRAAYQEAGVPEMWMIDPNAHEFHVDSRVGEVPYRTELLKKGRWSSRVLPGFWVDVAWLWTDPLPDPTECLQRILAGSAP